MSSEKPTTGPSDDSKRKFREALDKKNKQNVDRDQARPEGDSVVHGTHGPASQKREFRRKSG